MKNLVPLHPPTTLCRPLQIHAIENRTGSSTLQHSYPSFPLLRGLCAELWVKWGMFSPVFMRFCARYAHCVRESSKAPQQGLCRKGKTMDLTSDLYPVVRIVRFREPSFGKFVDPASDDPEALRPDIHSSTHNEYYYW